MADLDLTPMRWIWAPVTKGDTYPAANLTETKATETLATVTVTIKDSDGNTDLTLSSATSGVTINTATAGAWDYTIDEINPVTLAAGVYSYELQTTDGAGTLLTEFEGTWEILGN